MYLVGTLLAASACLTQAGVMTLEGPGEEGDTIEGRRTRGGCKGSPLA